MLSWRKEGRKGELHPIAAPKAGGKTCLSRKADEQICDSKSGDSDHSLPFSVACSLFTLGVPQEGGSTFWSRLGSSVRSRSFAPLGHLRKNAVSLVPFEVDL